MTSILHPALPSDIALTTTDPQLRALFDTVAISPLDGFGWIRITGEDRVRWLNGMVTNSIQDLKPGEGCYNFVLSAQGRIQGTANAFAQADDILLETDRAHLPGLMATLDRFIIMDDVELADTTATTTGIAVIGPTAPALLEQLGLPVPPVGSLAIQTATWRGADVTVITAHSPLTPRFELWTNPATAESLTAALVAAGATPCDASTLEQLRILEGTPRYGIDIRDRELPQETAQTRALHFSKGCYLGQEIVERIRSRGNVHRTFAAFRLDGTLPASGTALEAEGKPIGELTSVTAVPTSDGTLQIGLGYIRREALDRALPLTYAGGTAAPITLPLRGQPQTDL